MLLTLFCLNFFQFSTYSHIKNLQAFNTVCRLKHLGLAAAVGLRSDLQSSADHCLLVAVPQSNVIASQTLAWA